MKDYDVVVVGAGHAGCEAAYAAARLGASVLLVTFNMDHIAQMSCNPAIGGIAKGQVVREIDALGGAMGIVSEAAAIQFRMLNRTKGPAVWSPRAQCDKAAYRGGMKFLLENTPDIDILQSEVTSFIVENESICGIVTHLGDRIRTRAVVLTTGTSLNGTLHYGLNHYPGGRAGDQASCDLSTAINQQLGIELGRLKTGTPPRILAKTIDFAGLELQPSEPEDEEFSFWSRALRPSLVNAVRRDLPCYMLHSTDETAEVVRANISKSPMYSGVIKGIGTRYCPSFEDKVIRFPQHPYHLLFLEPEGAETGEYYLNGFSSSLPPEVQKLMLRTLPGLKDAVISRYAYAIEYDFIPPHQTDRTLRNKKWCNLFTAGQINGTSGYEEAAGQGLVAGMNAARHAAGKSGVFPGRDQSYIGVMLDDLSTKEIVEPYRLFTSRAEYRLTLRQENADLRLCRLAHEWGILPDAKFAEYEEYEKLFFHYLNRAKQIKSGKNTLFAALRDVAPGTKPFRVPEIAAKFDLPDTRIGRRVWQELLISAKYDGYLQREEQEIIRLKKLEESSIPEDFDYSNVRGLCNESRQKLEKVRPVTLGQAGRIDGVTPADIGLLQVHLKKLRGKVQDEK
ncbi:MAG: tRNA uridine-5-carboxymethylaminomethyl(34) synthesis enzyme MnmG [Lentisphaerae bacterium]|nr:tRNA uridine-5-carboxymethylaminomethyl(34) synthesis enzyme MnmG [Lentisphaerota bacterium]